jgi:DNA replication protein DnaC
VAGDRTIRLKPDAPASDVRRAHGYGMRLDALPVALLAARRPEVLVELEGGVFGVRVRCRSCSLNTVLRLEGDDPELRAKYGDGWDVTNVLPAIAIWVAQRWCCDACSARELEAAERADAASVVRKRIDASSVPGGLAAEVSWASMIEKGSSQDETRRRLRAIEVCRLWAEQATPKHAILLHGPAGTGKTRLAATAAMARLQHSPIQWVSVAVLMAQLSASWSDADRLAALKVLTGKGPVVLDDLDKITPTQSAVGHLFTAIDRRVQANQHAVIFTTNAAPSELEGKLGDVLVSRIIGMCGAQGTLRFPGPDRRLEMGED